MHVLPANADRNQPPVPPELIGRTVAGQTVTIQAALYGPYPSREAIKCAEAPVWTGTVTATARACDVGAGASHARPLDPSGLDRVAELRVDGRGNAAVVDVRAP